MTKGLSWGHININVSDLDAALTFYGKLGFSLFMPGIPYLGIARDELAPIHAASAEALGLVEGTQARGCIVGLGDHFPKVDLIELQPGGSAVVAGNDGRGLVRLCLASRDVDADYQRLSAEGVTFLSEPVEAQSGMARIAVCQDPEYTLIELIQIFPERWGR